MTIQSSLNLIFHVDFASLPIKDTRLSMPLAALVFSFFAFCLHLFESPQPTSEEVIINGRLVSQELESSLFSYLTFTWVNPLLDLGRQKPLEEEDLPHLTREDQTEIVITKWTAYRFVDGI